MPGCGVAKDGPMVWGAHSTQVADFPQLSVACSPVFFTAKLGATKHRMTGWLPVYHHFWGSPAQLDANLSRTRFLWALWISAVSDRVSALQESHVCATDNNQLIAMYMFFFDKMDFV